MLFELNEKEIDQAASLLAKLTPGYLPQRLFDEINRLHVTATVVFIPLKRTAAGPQVLLIQRGHGPKDPVWPGHWHLPGTMLRPNDKEGEFSTAFERLLEGELRGISVVKQPQLLRIAFTETKRGRELAQLYTLEIEGDPTAGQLFAVNQLPTPIIKHEVGYIKEVAKTF